MNNFSRSSNEMKLIKSKETKGGDTNNEWKISTWHFISCRRWFDGYEISRYSLGLDYRHALPFILIGLGAIGIKNNSKVIGGILVAIGGFMLIGKLAGIFALLLAIGLIFWGVSMFKSRRRV